MSKEQYEKLEEKLNLILIVLQKSLDGIDYALDSLYNLLQALPVETQESIKQDLVKFFDSMEASIKESRYTLKPSLPNNSKKFII